MSLDCPCEFGTRFDLGAFSREWHRQHREHHLAVFPNVDQSTRDNLEDFIYHGGRSIRERAKILGPTP